MTGSYYKIFKAALITAGGIIAACLLLLCINMGVLLHAEERAVYTIDRETALIIADGSGNTDIIFRDKDGVYIHKLVFEVGVTGERPADIAVTITLAGEESHVYTDLNPIFVGSEVVPIDLEGITGISIRGEGFNTGSLWIDNSLSFNLYAVLFGFLAGAVLTSLIVCRRFFAERPWLSFLVIGSAMGISMLFALPRTKVGYDEETHLQAVFAIAALPSGELHLDYDALNQVTVTEYNNPSALPGAYEEMEGLDEALTVSCDYKTGENTPDFSIIVNRVPAYIFMAAALKAGKFLSLGWPYLILAVRFANLVLYILLMGLAIGLVPVGKPLMALIGLFPQNIFMAVTCSYDPFITACMCLGYAFMLRGRRYLAPMLAAFVLACLPKAVYAPVILMGLGAMYMSDIIRYFGKKDAVGESTDSTGNKSSAVSHRTAAGVISGAIIFLILVAVFILPAVIAPEDTGDVRGGAVSMLGQVGFILAHPVRYACILFSNMARTLVQFWYGADGMTFMGHVLNGESGFRGYVAAYRIMLLMTVLLSYAKVPAEGYGKSGLNGGDGTEPRIKEGAVLTVPVRLWMAAMSFAAAVLVWTAMYVAFTEPGAWNIGGVQGRYFIPLYFPVYLAVSGTGTVRGDRGDAAAGEGKLERAVHICYYLIMLCGFLFLALTIWTTVISRYCL